MKEYYFYLDSTPTHSYMKYLYKYPQVEFPYADLVETNRRRTRDEMEYELLDTGAFAGDRYFDVFVEYAKGGPEDILMKITTVIGWLLASRAASMPCCCGLPALTKRPRFLACPWRGRGRSSKRPSP